MIGPHYTAKGLKHFIIIYKYILTQVSRYPSLSLLSNLTRGGGKSDHLQEANSNKAAHTILNKNVYLTWYQHVIDKITSMRVIHINIFLYKLRVC